MSDGPRRLAATLMIQGASSSVGKSLLVAALCRVFARRGVRVVPFKAQNMSNNAAVCPDGGEIGRAQALQALAAGVEPSTDMNPILLKPEADHRSQVVVHGRAWQTMSAGQYYERKRLLWGTVVESLDRLRAQADLVVIEGAGSPAELNLRASDVVNMAVARHLGAPVLLVGDIDRGGVFAQLLGTLWLLPDDEQRLIRGFIVNKFRGDPALFADGVTILQERGERPVLGVLPHLPDLDLPEEDAATLDDANQRRVSGKRADPPVSPLDEGRSRGVGSGDTAQDGSRLMPPAEVRPLDIAVIRLPHIANFDDFDPLRAEAGVRLRFVDSVEALGQPDAVILPGSKATIADLDWLRARGLADRIVELSQGPTTGIVGVCGGYQMLGRSIRDPDRVESNRAEAPGLGLLPIATTFATTKATRQTRATVAGGPGWLGPMAGHTIDGYEIHAGQTEVDPGAGSWLTLAAIGSGDHDRPDGAATSDGRIWGGYLHGLFDDDRFRRAWLASLQTGSRPDLDSLDSSPSNHTFRVQSALDRLADAAEAALDVAAINRIIREHYPSWET